MAPHDPRTAAAVDVLDLERLGIGARLPDDLVEVDGWWLRASDATLHAAAGRPTYEDLDAPPSP